MFNYRNVITLIYRIIISVLIILCNKSPVEIQNYTATESSGSLLIKYNILKRNRKISQDTVSEIIKLKNCK